jgi:hypothetical protein
MRWVALIVYDSPMLARKQDLNTQLQQLVDALLLAVSLWVAYVLRFYATSWFHLAYTVDPFRNYQWLFVVTCRSGRSGFAGLLSIAALSLSILDGGPSTGDFGSQFC